MKQKFLEALQYNHHIDNYSLLNSIEEKNNICYEECISMITNYYQIKYQEDYQNLIGAFENKDITKIKKRN